MRGVHFSTLRAESGPSWLAPGVSALSFSCCWARRRSLHITTTLSAPQPSLTTPCCRPPAPGLDNSQPAASASASSALPLTCASRPPHRHSSATSTGCTTRLSGPRCSFSPCARQLAARSLQQSSAAFLCGSVTRTPSARRAWAAKRVTADRISASGRRALWCWFHAWIVV